LLKPLADWLNDRTGFRTWTNRLAAETIPGGSRWRYVFGSTLAAVFLIQAVTGVLMMTAYSPSSATAWGSVYFINDHMWMGWFIRGLHHFAAQAVMVLLVLHLLQVLWAGAYRSPREVNWWLGLVLLVLVVGFSHTGYQLPWDQKGYWATKVVTNIIGGVPWIGPALRTLVVGDDYGNETITRFYGIHVGILPALTFLCLGAHLVLRWRHGLTAPPNPGSRPDEPYWPDQAFRNAVSLTLVVGVLVGLVLASGGAPLDAPADPSSADYPARPEWFFLSLFQLLKHLPGRFEWVGSVVLPAAILGFLFLLPLLERLLPARLVHRLGCGVVGGLLLGAGYLTYESLAEDASDPQFAEARNRADAARDRARLLASSPEFGIPPEGAGFLLRTDPLTRGRELLEKKCLGCHRYEGEGTAEQKASDLAGFGSYAWIRGLLEAPQDPKYFGKAEGCDGMAEWKQGSKLKSAELDQVAEFVASFARIPDDLTPDEWLDLPEVAEHPGNELFQKDCGSCHRIEGFTEGGVRDAPGLFGWGSPRWITRMIRKPGAPDLYGFLDRHLQMPAFGADQLTSNDVAMLVRYLRYDYLPPVAGSSAAVAAQP
jgi:quinol-cytochrome oxidoreductase complex cytochrome b subunit/mono/diheme cytochrome c family protein